MKHFPIIIISGPPCTGKTTLGKLLSEKFNLPFIAKDGIKELLFDSLGWSDREWSKKLGMASYDLLYYFMGAQLTAHQPFIIESNFEPKFHTERFLHLKKQFGFLPIQILCSTDGNVLLERFKQRSTSGQRHPGHGDANNAAEFKDSLLRGKYDPLEVGGEVIEVDTTDFSAVDYPGLFEKINAALRAT